MGSHKCSRFGLQLFLTGVLLALVPVVLAGSKAIPGGALTPPGPIDGSTATVAFPVSTGDFLSGAVVDEVTISITFSKVGGGTCPGPGGGDDWAEEIRFRLLAPDGTVVTLVQYGDYSYSSPDVGQVTVVFDDDAERSVSGLKIQSGTFKPSSGALANFRGLDPAADGGVWTLKLSDQWVDDPLCFSSATLQIDTLDPADLSVGAVGTPDPVHPGESLVYEITVHNAGPTTVPMVVTDTLPSALTYVSDTGGCSLGPGPGGAEQLVCTADAVVAGASYAFQILTRLSPDQMVADLDGTVFITNTTEVSSEYPELVPEDNRSVESTLVTDLADLRVVKLSQPMTTVHAGDPFTYTIFVDNLGPSFARNVVLTDTILSSGAFTLLGIVDDPGRPDSCSVIDALGGTLITCEPGEPLDSQGAGAENGRWEIQLSLRALEAQSVSNVVEVRSQDPDGSGPGAPTADPDLSNNQALTFLSVAALADLELSKVAVGQVQVPGQPWGTFTQAYDQVTVGGLLTYTLAVTNAGPSTAANVTVEDLLPASLSVEHVTSSRGACHWGTPGDPADPLSCNLGTLALGDGAVITITTRVPVDGLSGTVLYNEAWGSSDTYDPDNADNLVTILTPVETWADLQLTMRPPTGSILAGEPFTYTVTVSNLGPSNAAGAVVSNTIPAGMTNVVWTCHAAGGATCNPAGAGALVEALDLPAGTAVTYTVHGVLATSAAITNVAAVIAPPLLPDPYPANNHAAFTLNVDLYRTFLPLALRRFGVGHGPDLVVQGMVVTSDTMQVLIRNQGDGPVTSGFWVDVYVDPSSAPERVGQLWSDLCAQGLVWGVEGDTALLAPGQTLTLTVGDASYRAPFSKVTWPLPDGALIYAQVDSYGGNTLYGAVLENHEQVGGPYNNVWGPARFDLLGGLLRSKRR